MDLGDDYSPNQKQMNVFFFQIPHKQGAANYERHKRQHSDDYTIFPPFKIQGQTFPTKRKTVGTSVDFISITKT